MKLNLTIRTSKAKRNEKKIIQNQKISCGSLCRVRRTETNSKALLKELFDISFFSLQNFDE